MKAGGRERRTEGNMTKGEAERRRERVNEKGVSG